MSKNIGGSILASSSPEILRPMPFKDSIWQVVPDHDQDTHHLTLNGGVIASHPNGYSCHELAARMIAGNATKAMEQARYIMACGGRADLEAIAEVMVNHT